MPKPNKGEDKNSYIERFMSSEKAKSDYPDTKQRYAVAISMWNRRNKVTKSILCKARTGLVAQKKMITRGGKTYQTTVWVKIDKKTNKQFANKKKNSPEPFKLQKVSKEEVANDITQSAIFQIQEGPKDWFLREGMNGAPKSAIKKLQNVIAKENPELIDMAIKQYQKKGHEYETFADFAGNDNRYYNIMQKIKAKTIKKWREYSLFSKNKVGKWASDYWYR